MDPVRASPDENVATKEGEKHMSKTVAESAAAYRARKAEKIKRWQVALERIASGTGYHTDIAREALGLEPNNGF